MEFEILKRPGSVVLEVELEAGEAVGARRGALLAHSGEVAMEANVGGEDGIGGMVRRAVSDGTTPVETVFTAECDDATVALVPDYPGDVTAIDLTGTGPLSVQTGSMLAWEPRVEHSGVDGAGGKPRSENADVCGVSGQGWAFLSSFGAVYERDVTPGDPLVVDEDHLLAWSDVLDVSRERVGGIRTDALGGEGNVATFSGDGTVWLQTRNPLLFGPSRSPGTETTE
jgi:uncharacterized protein (TIGR00266 family)